MKKYLVFWVLLSSLMPAVTLADNGEEVIAGMAGLLFMLPFLLVMVIWLIMFCVIVASMIIWIWMLVDLVKREFDKPDDKTTWLLVVLLAGVVGAIVYYFVVYREDKSKKYKFQSRK